MRSASRLRSLSHVQAHGLAPSVDAMNPLLYAFLLFACFVGFCVLVAAVYAEVRNWLTAFEHDFQSVPPPIRAPHSVRYDERGSQASPQSAASPLTVFDQYSLDDDWTARRLRRLR